MQTHAQVVIVGGGVVGCSILFHLAKFGWKDVVLLERSELTSGSSWHAAGQFHTLSSDSNVTRMQAYTIGLYQELEALSGQSIGLHQTGQFYLASTPERLDYLKQERSKARYLGLDQEFITLAEVVQMNPLIDPSHYLGALYDPMDGYIDPSGVTYAYAKAAKRLGASYHRNTPVLETNPRPDGGWDVVTPNGTIHAEHVVNAGGLWAREVGHMAGINLPVQPMEHHYLITEDIPELVAHPKEAAAGIDYEANIYFRPEHKGLLLGTYEATATPWRVEGTPMDFGHELLSDDLERVSDRLSMAFERIPALAQAGIKNVINGPFTFGPDGNPIIGPVPGLQNYWVAVGVMAGFCQAGGVGLCMAQWMIEGEPSLDVWAMDVARFGEFATREYGTVKSSENYGRRFQMTYPNEQLPAMREQKTTALYDRLLERGAVMGVGFGLEHALWFADTPENASEQPSFRRSNAFGFVAQEVSAVREQVGAIEIANYAKHEFKGPGAAAFLDHLLAARMPTPGRMTLTPMLSPKGRLIGDLTVACQDANTYYLFGSGGAQEFHRRWFDQQMPHSGVRYRNRSDELHGMGIAGPNSRELLSRLCRDDVSAAGLKFRDFRNTSVAGVPVLLARISFSVAPGYEIYTAAPYQRRLFAALEQAGRDLGLRLYGNRALMSLRLEKGWGVWNADFSQEFTVGQSGLDAFVDFNKPDFIGRQAALAEREHGADMRMVTLVVEADEVDCSGSEAVMHEGTCVGYVTSGGYAHHTGNSVAIAYAPTALALDGNAFEVEILGQQRPARLHQAPLYDPSGARMRS